MKTWHSSFLAVAAIAPSLMWTGCGSSKEALVSVTVSPTSASATHGSASDTVTFKATGHYSAYDTDNRQPSRGLVCAVKVPDSSNPVAGVTWSTSDSTNTTIDASGVARCVGATSTPATITAVASGACGDEDGTAMLTCN